MNHVYKVILSLMILPVVLNAQTSRCYTTEHMNQLKAQDPRLEQRLLRGEELIQQWIKENNGWQNLRDVPDTIPVVVHVVWKTTAQNIADSQVISQIEVLNEDFARLNADSVNTPIGFQDEASAVPFRFCLAKRDPEGNPSTGIERRETTVSSWSDNAIKFYGSGGLDAWDPSKYMNIWVGNLSGGVLGFAEFPTSQVSNTFGVVITYNAFGRVGNVIPPYHLGRTATHEFSHCFNLFHIWGDDGGSCNGSDLVGDTPNQADATFGCPNYPKNDPCNSTADGIMFTNYQDYSDDDCMNMFTAGQADRMVGAIDLYYPSLLTSDGCQEVILQAVDAGSTKVFSPVGDYCSTSISPVVRIKNWGTTDLASVNINYQIDGGPVSTYNWSGLLSSLDTVSVSLPAINTTPGSHSLVAFTSEPNGITDQNISNDTTSSDFEVITSGIQPPVIESFNLPDFPPADWILKNPDAGITYERNTTYKKSGQASAWVEHFNYETDGQIDDLVSLHVDLSTLEDPAISYWYAYTYYNGSDGPFYDSLRIYISPDCGITLNKIYHDGGNTMKTANPVASAYHPTAAQWIQKVIDLTPYASYTNATFIFRSVNGYGNNFYFDDINIFSNTGVGLADPASLTTITIAPNPGNGIFTVDIQSPYFTDVNLVVMNITGERVYEEKRKHTQNEVYKLNLSHLPAGSYLLKLESDNFSEMKKVVVLH